MTIEDFPVYHTYFYLNDDKTVRPCDSETWGNQMIKMATEDTKHVAQEQIDKHFISTVWLGLNHRWGSGQPLIFETMIFDPNHKDIYQERYSTWDEAIEGHEKAVEWFLNNEETRTNNEKK